MFPKWALILYFHCFCLSGNPSFLHWRKLVCLILVYHFQYSSFSSLLLETFPWAHYLHLLWKLLLQKGFGARVEQFSLGLLDPSLMDQVCIAPRPSWYMRCFLCYLTTCGTSKLGDLCRLYWEICCYFFSWSLSELHLELSPSFLEQTVLVFPVPSAASSGSLMAPAHCDSLGFSFAAVPSAIFPEAAMAIYYY